MQYEVTHSFETSIYYQCTIDWSLRYSLYTMTVAVFGLQKTPLPTRPKNSHWLNGDSMLPHEDQPDWKMQTNESFACWEDKQKQDKCLKTNLVGPLLPGQVPSSLIETIQRHRTKNASIPCLKVWANILFSEVTWWKAMLNEYYRRPMDTFEHQISMCWEWVNKNKPGDQQQCWEEKFCWRQLSTLYLD